MPQGERHVHPHPERAGVMYPFVGIPTFLRSALCTDLDVFPTPGRVAH